MPSSSVMAKRAEQAAQIATNALRPGPTATLSVSPRGYQLTATQPNGDQLRASGGSALLAELDSDALQADLVDAAIKVIRTRLAEIRQAEEAAAAEAERAEFERTPTEREAERLEEIEMTVGHWEKRNAEGIAHLADSSRAMNFNGNDVEIAAQVAGRCEVLRWLKPVVDGEHFAEKSIVEKLAVIEKRVGNHLALVGAMRSTAGANMVDGYANEVVIEVWRILNDRNLH